MCSASSPKVDQSAVDAQKKPPQYLRNPWLDGLSIQGSGASTGRNSLVIAPGTKPPPATTNTSPLVPPVWTPTNTNLGIGAGGGFAGGGGGGFGIGIGRGTGIKQR